jgi:hypothetical protein
MRGSRFGSPSPVGRYFLDGIRECRMYPARGGSIFGHYPSARGVCVSYTLLCEPQSKKGFSQFMSDNTSMLGIGRLCLLIWFEFCLAGISARSPSLEHAYSGRKRNIEVSGIANRQKKKKESMICSLPSRAGTGLVLVDESRD